MKIFIALAFAAIIGALVFAGVCMVRGKPPGSRDSKQMANALALRVALSIALFLCILVGYKLGWIHPTGIRTG